MQKEIKWNANINLKSYFFKHNYDDWSENKESTDKGKSIDLSDMPPLEEATGRKWLKILTPSKSLTRRAI